MIETIDRADDPRIAAYADVGNHAALRQRGLFVAEGRIVVRRLIEHRRFDLDSIAVTAAALKDFEHLAPELSCPVFVCTSEILHSITGFDFHRGCLALARRPQPANVKKLLQGQRVLALEGVGNPDNIGGLFRVAAAMSVAGIVLDPACGDPLYRKAIRTSMGAVLQVPFAHIESWPEAVEPFREAGFQVVALTPAAGAISIQHFVAQTNRSTPLLLMLGAEGPGLSAAAIDIAHIRVRIPIADGVDSLNVAVAAGIALSMLSDAG